MKLSEILKDKFMGVYIDIIKGEKILKTVYQGMKGNRFYIKTHEDLKENEEVCLRLSISGLNLSLPCVVESIEKDTVVLKPHGKVKITEKRKEKRIPLTKGCTINGEKGNLIDISYHGARVLTLVDFPLGVDATLIFDKYMIKGKVRWKRNEEVDLKSIGIYFEDPDKWWVEFVKEHIKKYIQALRRM